MHRPVGGGNGRGVGDGDNRVGGWPFVVGEMACGCVWWTPANGPPPPPFYNVVPLCAAPSRRHNPFSFATHCLLRNQRRTHKTKKQKTPQ
jgi:hypothetical protein